MSAALSEEFVKGEFKSYDVYDEALRTVTDNKRHADLRVFKSGEGWTNGTVGVDANGIRQLSWAIASGANNTASVLTAEPVDLTGFAGDDHFSVALPSFPLASVTLATSFIDLTSHPQGDFTVGPTVSLALNGSLVPLVAGDSEFRVLNSSLAGIDLGKVTGVRLRATATANATLKVNAIRVLDKDWKHSGVDVDTRTGTLRRLPNRIGTLVTDYDQPILWRSAQVPGTNDPRPIDCEMSVIFNTGSATGSNRFTLYFRELTEDFLTMLDLNGMTMAELDGKMQPDVGDAKYGPRTIADLERFTLSQLETETLFGLERTPDFFSASWIEFSLQWGVNPTVSILTTEGNGYSLPVTGLVANTDYVFYTTLEENSVRATIYTLSGTGAVLTKVFDSTRLDDDTAYPRRKGRFGWHANLTNGDAYIDSVRSRGATYAEYRSLPFASQTPVVGAELFASNSPGIELFEYVKSNSSDPSVARVEPDNSNSTSGQSWKVSSFGATNPGVLTNPFEITDFQNTTISFDLYYPSGAVPLDARLYTPTLARSHKLVLPTIVFDQWQRIEIELPFGQEVMTGPYLLSLVQTGANVISAWWIDKISIKERSVIWDGRAVVDDPWKSNDARWTPFKDNYSRDSGGILFPRRGTDLQVRGRARHQDGNINRVQFKPRYAELGRIKPNATAPSAPPVPSFSTATLPDGSISFTPTATTPSGYVANWEWNFGDGTKATGSAVTHKYEQAGVYTVTLVATDSNGNQGTNSNTVAA